MTKRIFIAIDISDEARDLADAYVRNLRLEFRDLRVGWEKREKLHLTLKFLGETDQKGLRKLIGAVTEVARRIPPFQLELSGTGHFGKRILWLGLNDQSGSLSKIYDLLEAELAKTGFPKETKRFNPHLTVARLREPNRSTDLLKSHSGNSFGPVSFEVGEIVVYESLLGPAGSKYHEVATLSLDPDRGKMRNP